jgi:Raf kinase inhibitor-like YbhB/YbcL family protein
MGRDPYAGLPSVPDFHLVSSTVADGATLPLAQHSGIFGTGGEDQSPQLSWAGFPDSTQSFIVSMYDPDAPTPSGFWHWAVVDIPAGVTALALGAGEADSTLPAGRHLTNDGGLRRYIGAAPVPGLVHHYYIVVTALDVPTTGVPDTASPALTFFQTLGHVVARGRLVPEYAIGKADIHAGKPGVVTRDD